MSQPTYLPDGPELEGHETPRHGYRGQSGPPDSRSPWPKSLTLAITREAGARGGTIASRIGGRLGWQVFSQELMEYMAQEGKVGAGLFDPLPDAAVEWIERRLAELMREQNLSRNPTVIDLARVVLTLGAQGEVILLGRGAGCILPSATTLHVRLVAPLADRIAYMSQWMRLTEEEAAEQVRKRDSRRADFISTHFHRRPSDVHQYDLVLNTSYLGEERCTELIVQAAKLKLTGLGLEAD
jgi:cytidylate kinase